MEGTAALILAVWSAASGGGPQDRPAAGAGGEQVVVPVTVKDAQGRLVSGLGRADFRLFEDGVEQKIAGFSSGPWALSVAVVIDAALSRPTAQRLRETFPSLVEAFSEFDEAGVFSFDTGFRTHCEFTSDKDRLLGALRQMEMGAEYAQAGEPMTAAAPRINRWPVGGAPASGAAQIRLAKNIDEAVLAAVRRVAARRPERRKVVLLISDGFRPERNRTPVSSLLVELRRSGVIVYTIGLDEARLTRAASPLARYGPPTGGELFPALRKAAIESCYPRIAEQARYLYVLNYVSGRPPSVAPALRSIEVRVRRPGLRVIAPDGYLPESRPPQPSHPEP